MEGRAPSRRRRVSDGHRQALTAFASDDATYRQQRTRARPLTRCCLLLPPIMFANFTSKDIPNAGLPPDWKISLRAESCHPQNTLRYEQDDVRTTLLLLQRWTPSPKLGLFVDIGANCGVYSLIVASLGHRCIAIDPLPRCVEAIKASAADNGFDHSVAVFNGGVSDAAFNFPVPLRVCSPYYSLGATSETRRRAGLWSASDSNATTQAQAYPLTEVLQWAGQGTHDAIMMVKIDAEGHEVRILSSMRHLLRHQKIDIVLWELTPSKWLNANVTRAHGIATLNAMFSQSYHSFFSSRPAFCDRHGLTTDVCQFARHPSPIAIPSGARYIASVADLADAMLSSNWTAAENVFSVAVRETDTLGR